MAGIGVIANWNKAGSESDDDNNASHHHDAYRAVAVTIASGQSVAIAADDAVKGEGNRGPTSFTFTVTRDGDTSSATTVDWAVTGSATNHANAADFGGMLPSGQVSFSTGESTKTLTVPVIGDTDVESDEGFTVTLSNASGGATISKSTATATIEDDDRPIRTIHLELAGREDSSVLVNGDLTPVPNGMLFDIVLDLSTTDSKGDLGGYGSFRTRSVHVTIPDLGLLIIGR